MKSKSTIFLAFLIGSGLYSAAASSQTVNTPAQSPSTSAEPVIVDASSSTASVYLHFQDGALVTSADNAGWQIAVKRTQFQTNSGTSGQGHVGVYNTESTDFDSVTECSAKSLTSNTTLPASGAPGSQPFSGNEVLNAWYDYDINTHIVSSKQLVYLIVDGDSCFKFQIADYQGGKYSVKAAGIAQPAQEEPAPTVSQQTINAASAAATVYLALENGQLVPSTVDGNWLVAVKRTQWQTNSGTSGTGSVGVYDSGSTDFAALASCEGLTFTSDALLPASGAPGSLPYSGNEILNAWYNYDMDTHIVTSKQNVYAISNGEQCVKFQILSWQDGRYAVQLSELK